MVTVIHKSSEIFKNKIILRDKPNLVNIAVFCCLDRWAIVNQTSMYHRYTWNTKTWNIIPTKPLIKW